MAMLDLEPLNAALKVRGLRMQVEQRSNALVVWGTFPDSNGSSRRRPISLNLLAVPDAKAQWENHWRSSYNQWNRSYPGYGSAPREIRQQVREMNPYRSSYSDWNRQYGGSYRRSNGW